MRLKSHRIVLILLISVVFIKCTVSKRHYRKGFHVAWHNNTQPASKTAESNKKIDQVKANGLESYLTNLTEITKNEITASTERLKVLVHQKKHIKQLRLNNDTCADVIIFRDGTELTVKVVEVFNNTVKFLPCNNLTGPLRVLNGEKVFMVKYADGTKVVLKEPVKTSTAPAVQSNPTPRKTNGLALASFITVCLAAFFPPIGIISVILGAIALGQMANFPERYKGKWMAKTGIIAGAILSVLYITAYLLS